MQKYLIVKNKPKNTFNIKIFGKGNTEEHIDDEYKDDMNDKGIDKCYTEAKTQIALSEELQSALKGKMPRIEKRIENITNEIKEKYLSYKDSIEKSNNEGKKSPNEDFFVNISGYSRGAVTSILLANKIAEIAKSNNEEDKWAKKIKFNMLLWDPCPGPFYKVEESYIIPDNIKDVQIIYAEKKEENSLNKWLLSHIAPQEFFVEDPNKTSFSYISLDLHHNLNSIENEKITYEKISRKHIKYEELEKEFSKFIEGNNLSEKQQKELSTLLEKEKLTKKEKEKLLKFSGYEELIKFVKNYKVNDGDKQNIEKFNNDKKNLLKLLKNQKPDIIEKGLNIKAENSLATIKYDFFAEYKDKANKIIKNIEDIKNIRKYRKEKKFLEKNKKNISSYKSVDLRQNLEDFFFLEKKLHDAPDNINEYHNLKSDLQRKIYVKNCGIMQSVSRYDYEFTQINGIKTINKIEKEKTIKDSAFNPKAAKTILRNQLVVKIANRHLDRLGRKGYGVEVVKNEAVGISYSAPIPLTTSKGNAAAMLPDFIQEICRSYSAKRRFKWFKKSNYNIAKSLSSRVQHIQEEFEKSKNNILENLSEEFQKLSEKQGNKVADFNSDKDKLKQEAKEQLEKAIKLMREKVEDTIIDSCEKIEKKGGSSELANKIKYFMKKGSLIPDTIYSGKKGKEIKKEMKEKSEIYKLEKGKSFFIAPTAEREVGIKEEIEDIINIFEKKRLPIKEKIIKEKIKANVTDINQKKINQENGIRKRTIKTNPGELIDFRDFLGANESLTRTEIANEPYNDVNNVIDKNNEIIQNPKREIKTDIKGNPVDSIKNIPQENTDPSIIDHNIIRKSEQNQKSIKDIISQKKEDKRKSFIQGFIEEKSKEPRPNADEHNNKKKKIKKSIINVWRERTKNKTFDPKEMKKASFAENIVKNNNKKLLTENKRKKSENNNRSSFADKEEVKKGNEILIR